MSDRKLLLEVRDLKTFFFTDSGIIQSVNGVDFSLQQRQTLGLVGESGCGKSVTAFSILKAVSRPGKIMGGEVLYHRPLLTEPNSDQNPTASVPAVQVSLASEVIDLVTLDPRSEELRQIRGGEIAMIYQEPMVALSAMHTVGFQITEMIRLHQNVSKSEARSLVIALLARVGIPSPEEWIDRYPFQLSGGMRQRVMIAMALSCNPKLLIADEPTTALDVTTQAQILDLLRELQDEFGMAILLITHDLGVVAENCDEVAVMYLGEVVEQADVDSIFYDPLHPYTRSLLQSIPVLGRSRTMDLNPIEGSVPDPYKRPMGCPFHPRCPQRMAGVCDIIHPKITRMADGRTVRCLLYEDVSESVRQHDGN